MSKKNGASEIPHDMLQSFISDLMSIQRRYGFERLGAATDRKAEVKQLVIKYAKKMEPR